MYRRSASARLSEVLALSAPRHISLFVNMDQDSIAAPARSDGMEEVRIHLHAANARLLSLESNTATQPGRPGRTQAARGREAVLTNSMHCEASAANLSVKRLDCTAAREQWIGFLSLVSRLPSGFL
jgi:hypothetical protein